MSFREIIKKMVERIIGTQELSRASSDPQIVDYDSPTGKAYIGTAKRPLMKHKEGFGFQGVLLQTEDKELVQCAACGEWLKFLNWRHLKSCCGLTHPEYKDKYGLRPNTALLCDETSKKYSLAVTSHPDRLERISKLGGANLAMLKPEARAKKARSIRKSHNSAEFQNGYGTCRAQLLAGLVDYVHTFKQLPVTSSGRRDAFASVIRNRFGSMNRAMLEYGFPTRRRRGWQTDYHFSDGTVMTRKSGDMTFYDRLYATMLEKCTNLTKTR